MEEEVKQYYKFSTQNVLIYNSKGKKIDISALNIGDNICVIKSKEMKKTDLAQDVKFLYNVKIIEVENDIIK